MLNFFKSKREIQPDSNTRTDTPEKQLTDVHWKYREDLKDLILIGVIGILAFVLTQALELNKVLNKMALEHDEWPILEFITVPTIMSFAFALYALRRWKEARKSAKKARAAANEAKKASAAKSQFLANMSHEIRTPMNAILGFAQILSAEELTDEQKEHVDIIQDSSKKLIKLIDDVLDLSKIEAGKIDLEISEFSLKEFLAGVAALMKPRAKIKRLGFEIYEDSSLPGRICSDSLRLRQCLINLIGNAIKFTKSGHVYVKVSSYIIDNESFIRFDVEDTGIGIPEDKQEVIFNSFVQADGGHTREFGGTGLGLSITKYLAELLR
ncbi:MAG: sensor histidine kinase, partial [Planctomycetota bacterium]